jgi:hypothetical protein
LYCPRNKKTDFRIIFYIPPILFSIRNVLKSLLNLALLYKFIKLEVNLDGVLARMVWGYVWRDVQTMTAVHAGRNAAVMDADIHVKDPYEVCLIQIKSLGNKSYNHISAYLIINISMTFLCNHTTYIAI